MLLKLSSFGSALDQIIGVEMVVVVDETPPLLAWTSLLYFLRKVR